MEHGKKKIALIQQICPSYRVKFFEKLSKMLDQKGFKLTVFFGQPQRGLTYSGIIPAPQNMEFGFDYKILPKIAYEGKLPTSPFHFKRAFIFFPTLIFEIGRGKYEITISDTTGDMLNTLPLLLINKFLLQKKFIVWCGGNIKDNAPKPSDSVFKKIAYALARLIYTNCDASIVYGPASKRFDVYMGTDPSRIFIALNTVDTIFFEEIRKTTKNEIEQVQRKLGIIGKKCILYVGVLEKRKKLDNLILAFKELTKSMNDTVLLIVGDGPQKEALQDLCVKEKIKNVHFLGKINYKRIPLFYALCDVFVLPAQGGIAVAEAMASGKPVVITEECNALRSVPLLVKHGENGFIAKEGDINSLTQYMLKVLSDPLLAKNMGIKSKEMVKKYFSVKKMLHGFEQAIDYVVAQKK
jgi:glycosyltransferase involved in cell wall biosynthesis